MVGLVKQNMGWLVVLRDSDRRMAREFRITLEKDVFAAGCFDSVDEVLLKFFDVQDVPFERFGDVFSPFYPLEDRMSKVGNTWDSSRASLAMLRMFADKSHITSLAFAFLWSWRKLTLSHAFEQFYRTGFCLDDFILIHRHTLSR